MDYNFDLIKDNLLNYDKKFMESKKSLKENVNIKPTIQIYDSEGNTTKLYNNAIKKMIDTTYDVDLEQFDFDEVANGNCKELDKLVMNLCKKSGLGSKDIYSMLWNRFQDEYDVEFNFDIYSEDENDLFESKKSTKKILKESLAINHESNIEHYADVLMKKHKDLSVTYDFDDEDCYFDISQENQTTGNISVWSFCIDFGVGKVYMLEPRSKELDDFNSDSEILRIIQNNI